MKALIKRNLLLFFRNKRGVVSSLTAALVVILIYVCFLGDNLKSALRILGDVDLLIMAWILAGFISVVSMTSAIGAMSLRIRDEESGILRDFTCSPLPSYQIAFAYIFSSFLIGWLLSIFTWMFSQGCLLAMGGSLPTLVDTCQTLLCLTLSTLASTAILTFIVTLFHSMDTFSTVSSILSTLAGFLTGIYVPIGSLPPIAQTIITWFPLSHGASLLRQTMMRSMIVEKLMDVPAELLHDFYEELGILYYVDGKAISMGWSMLILLVTAIVFYGLCVCITKRKHG